MALAEQDFSKHTVPEPRFLRVLAEAIDAVEKEEIPYALIGGVASAVLGRPRFTQDVDFLVRPTDADRTLEALAASGFATQRTNPQWLFKGVKDDVIVDVIFQSAGEIYLDEEMLSRTRVVEFRGQRFRMAPPEDLVVMKALAHSEDTPRYWYDALSVLASTSLDWEYLLRRARHGAQRVLSLLLYASSNDLVVPKRVIRTLFELVYDS